MSKTFIIFATIMTVIMAGSSRIALGEANTNLPFADNFENYANGTPLIDGTNGWYGNSSDVAVQSDKFRTGTQAAMVPLDCTLTNRFQDIPSTNVWIQMDILPTLYDGVSNPIVDTNQAGVFYINSNGNFVVHDGPTSDPTNSTGWVVMTNAGVGTSGTNWVRVGIYVDYSQTNWDLYANGVLVLNAIGFVNTSRTNFADFNVYNGALTSYIDNVSVTAPGTVLLSPTNLSFHVMSGMTSSIQTVSMVAQSGDWSFSNTLSTAWLIINSGTGTVSAAAGATNLAIQCGAMPNGSYTGQVTVSLCNSDGARRMETIAVTLDVMDLNVWPNDLTISNGFMYSNTLAIPSQSFSISNAGASAFNFTIQPQGDTADWLSLSAYSGVAGMTNITVQYATGLAPRSYAGELWVTTTNGGGGTNRVTVGLTVVAPPVVELDPLSISQQVPKAGNPTNQFFTIRNASGEPKVPMAYSLTVSNGSLEMPLIQTLGSYGGVSTGLSQSVMINYMDISMYAPGVYTAMVNVAAWDAGSTYSPTGTVQLSTTLVVRVEVAALDSPLGVEATDGTYTNQVVVNWQPVANAVNYKIYRSSTFDWTLASPIGETVATVFNDLTGLPGVMYYYWVSSVNAYRGEGAMSTNRSTGYRALAPPGGIFATEGSYTNKVRVTWPLVDGATGYQLYRSVAGNAAEPIYFTDGGVYEDYSVVGGVHYEYKVGATNGVFGSQLSVDVTGYAFGVPDRVTASEGTYIGKVHLTWTAVESAVSYDIWRSTRAMLPPQGGAVKIASVTTPSYDDIGIVPGSVYYYWVRANGLEAGLGCWSAMARGYGAAAGLDLWVRDLVFLPVQIGVGASPEMVSFRMGNCGETNMVGANGTVGIEFLATTNQFLGAGDEISIGKVVTEVSLAIGADMVMKVAGSQLTLPSTDGDYNIFVRVLPESPSLLADTNPDDNVAERKGALRVRSDGGLNYQVFNDYDGDGISDLGVYRGMEWSIRSVDDRKLATGLKIFGGAGLPVLGDLDGDMRSDPMVFDNASGLWQVLYSGSGYMWASGVFGSAGYRGLVADYEGVGHGEPSVFHQANGRWFVLNANGGLTVWNWGDYGYVPVTGDYDGDGCWDMAVYQESTGLWYIRTLNDQLLVSGAIWGGPGCVPVPGDYDGDGRWDAAIYVQSSGRWYIASLDGRILGWGVEWGALGFEPVMGDYDGDGKWDLGVYQEATGRWYIRDLDGNTLAWASQWGGPGYRPLGN